MLYKFHKQSIPKRIKTLYFYVCFKSSIKCFIISLC